MSFRKNLRLMARASGKNVQEQDGNRSEKHRCRRHGKYGFVRGHEFQLVHEPEAVGEQDGNRQKQCVCDHRNLLKPSLERLVFTEVGDRQSQRVDGNEFVGNLAPKTKTKLAV